MGIESIPPGEISRGLAIEQLKKVIEKMPIGSPQLLGFTDAVLYSFLSESQNMLLNTKAIDLTVIDISIVTDFSQIKETIRRRKYELGEEYLNGIDIANNFMNKTYNEVAKNNGELGPYPTGTEVRHEASRLLLNDLEYNLE